GKRESESIRDALLKTFNRLFFFESFNVRRRIIISFHRAKRVRFPKGKKGKPVDVIVEKVIVEENVNDLSNPVVAAKERMKRRNHITAELLSEEHGVISNNISAAEVKYQANENFVEDGIHIEPFNLDKEREEGYFDASGNFVEYVRDDEIKDAWLDNVEIDPRFAGLSTAATKDEEEVQELSSKDVAIMKRRIANVLEPEETVRPMFYHSIHS
ncbi:hypothetical protein L195_g044474, partial [Trifolium pratense]